MKEATNEIARPSTRRESLHLIRIVAPIVASILALEGAQAGSRSSANYSVLTEVVAAGGKEIASSSYRINASIGEIGASASATPQSITNKAGYVGQLYDPTGVLVIAPLNVSENTNQQLEATQVFDDLTTLALNPSAVTWSILNGPILSISSSGVASTGTVFQNTSASVRGAFQGFINSLTLNIQNVTEDDFGLYSGDGLPDDWQVQFFGENNANAAPNSDADRDGQSNKFEYTAGLVPTDSTSRFELQIEAVAGQPAQKRLIFSPAFGDRTYVVESRPTLHEALVDWSDLTPQNAISNGNQRTVLDLNANGPLKFYRVRISKP